MLYVTLNFKNIDRRNMSQFMYLKSCSKTADSQYKKCFLLLSIDSKHTYLDFLCLVLYVVNLVQTSGSLVEFFCICPRRSSSQINIGEAYLTSIFQVNKQFAISNNMFWKVLYCLSFWRYIKLEWRKLFWLKCKYATFVIIFKHSWAASN